MKFVILYIQKKHVFTNFKKFASLYVILQILS